MLGKPKDKYLANKIHSLISSPKHKPLLRDSSTQALDIADKTINTTDNDIKIFNLKKESLQSNYKKDWNDRDFDRISQSSYITRTIKDHDSKG